MKSLSDLPFSSREGARNLSGSDASSKLMDNRGSDMKAPLADLPVNGNLFFRTYKND
jgi:hypothetical protein